MEFEERNWEKLPKDCLVAILAKVGIESLLQDVPFVCKTWYRASLDPMCWRVLDFSKLNRPAFMHRDAFFCRDERRVIMTFIKSVVDRSCKSASKLVLPNDLYHFVGSTLEYMSNESPDLKILILESYLEDDIQKLLSELIFKWKKLEILWVTMFSLFVDTFAQIKLHCKKFGAFGCMGSQIGHEEALAITKVAGLKVLRIYGCFIDRDVLEMIIQKCKKLKLLDARDCTGFEEDSDLLKLTSHIKSFKCEGSVVRPSWKSSDSSPGNDESDHDIDSDDDPVFDAIFCNV